MHDVGFYSDKRYLFDDPYAVCLAKMDVTPVPASRLLTSTDFCELQLHLSLNFHSALQGVDYITAQGAALSTGCRPYLFGFFDRTANKQSGSLRFSHGDDII